MEFLIGIDSDGCVFDNMEPKHKECFCPEFILAFGLQPVSRYARQAWEFVNLYSKDRGINRFKAVTKALDLLAARKEVRARHAAVPNLKSLRTWAESETRLGEPALGAELERHPDEELKLVMSWSKAVNTAIKRLVFNVPPFPMVRESLEAMRKKADILVVSQTPTEALTREWEEHDIRKFACFLGGQEMGTKSEQIAFTAKGKYPAEKVLMIGDAIGDLEAARDNGAFFFPVDPGHEEESWKRLHEESLERFFNGAYAGGYEEKLVERFEGCLPGRPSWED